MFVVIDWIDWSGKWTQVERVVKELERAWKTVKLLDYPRYGKTSAFMVEKYLNGEYGNTIWPKLASIFYAVDRYDDSFNFREDIEKYDYVISNRYVSASMIHQAWKIDDIEEKENYINWLEDLEYNIFGIPRPDKTIFLNVSPEMSQRLVLKKQERDYLKDGKKMDIHEEDKDHLMNAHKTAMLVCDMQENWIKIDCEIAWEMRPLEDITSEIIGIIK